MRQRRVIEPSQLRKRKQRRRILKLSFWTVVVLILVSGLIFLTHLRSINISDVTFSGNDATPSDDLSHAVKDDISGNYYFLFPKSNIAFYPKKKIESDILKGYKGISAVSVSRTDLHSIHLSIEERKPASLWCTSGEIASSSSSCYFLDKSGYVFSKAPEVSGDIYFIYYGLIAAEDPVGRNYLPADKFKEVDLFINNIKALHVEADSLLANNGTDFELHLVNGGKILFTTNQPLDETIANLQTVIDKNNQKNVRVDLENIDYLDLRFGNKIFYRLKGGNTATTTADTGTNQ